MLTNNVAFVTLDPKSFMVVLNSLSALFIGKTEIDDLHLVLVRALSERAPAVDAAFVPGICICNQQNIRKPSETPGLCFSKVSYACVGGILIGGSAYNYNYYRM